MSRLFLTWEQLLHLPVDLLIPSPDRIRGYAADRAFEWISIFERGSDIQLTHEERVEVIKVFEVYAHKHWELPFVLKHNLQFQEFVENINEYSHRIPTTEVTDRNLTSGQAIVSYIITPSGFEIQIENPIITALVIARNCAYGVSDFGRRFRDFSAEDFFELTSAIHECWGGSRKQIDLSQWASQMPLPSYSELEASILALRGDTDVAASVVHA